MRGERRRLFPFRTGPPPFSVAMIATPHMADSQAIYP